MRTGTRATSTSRSRRRSIAMSNRASEGHLHPCLSVSNPTGSHGAPTLPPPDQRDAPRLAWERQPHIRGSPSMRWPVGPWPVQQRVSWQPSRFLVDRAEANGPPRSPSSWARQRGRGRARHDLAVAAQASPAIGSECPPATPKRSGSRRSRPPANAPGGRLPRPWTRRLWPSTQVPPGPATVQVELFAWVRRDEEYASAVRGGPAIG